MREEVLEFNYRKPLKPLTTDDMLLGIKRSGCNLRRQSLLAMKVLKRQNHSPEEIVGYMRQYFDLTVKYEIYSDGSSWTVY